MKQISAGDIQIGRPASSSAPGTAQGAAELAAAVEGKRRSAVVSPIPRTEEDVAEYMEACVLCQEPAEVRRMTYAQAWFGGRDSGWWRNPAAREEMKVQARPTPRAPWLTALSDGKIACEFYEWCHGSECRGVVLHRSGPDGSYAEETLCPEHREVWFHDAREWQKRYGLMDLGGYSGEAMVDEILSSEQDTDDALVVVRQHSQQRLQDARIPAYFARFTLEDWPGPVEVAREASEWVRQQPLQQGLLVMGGFGVGKTSLAASLLRERVWRYGDSALFMTAADMLDKLRPGVEMDEELLANLKRRRLLVIDDVGAERSSTEFANEQLWKVIHLRHGARLATIVTTNLRSSLLAGAPGASSVVGAVGPASNTGIPEGEYTLEQHLGVRTVNRFLDRDAFKVLVVRGPNLRVGGK